MSTVASEPPISGESSHSYSCLLCRQRKVKCNKEQPCSNCVKAGSDCVRITAAPPRRRKGTHKLSEEEMMRRLRHYEILLRSYGAKIEELGGRDPHSGNSESAAGTSQDPAQSITSSQMGKLGLLEHSRISLGHNLWISLSDEILADVSEDNEAAEASQDEDGSCSKIGTAAFFCPVNFNESLNHLHPPAAQIFSLWQTFLDNVNPLVKVIHVPTVQKQILKGVLDLESLSRPEEALIFSIYSCAITSLTDDECRKLTGESRSTLRARYQRLAEQALTRASFLGTLNIGVLQAAVLFLISLRPGYDPGEFWVLVGVVFRIGQRIGLHQESHLSSLSVLEVEIRRRLWWQINVIDAQSADRSGARASINAKFWEVALPLNINDSDLTADMVVAPMNQVGATEMVFCLMMYETGIFLRHSPSMAAFGGSWQGLLRGIVPLDQKEKVIDDLENVIERKYLRYLDPVIPLHILARGGFRMVSGRMRLTIHHPRQRSDRGANMTREEKKKLFTICLMIIEQDNFSNSTPSIRGFLWHLGLHFQLDAFVYLLSELQHAIDVPLAKRAWAEIARSFKNHPDLITDTQNTLTAALGILTLRSWAVHEAELHRQYPQRLADYIPSFISQIRAQKAQTQNNTLVARDSEQQLTSTPCPGNPGLDDTPFDINESFEFIPVPWDVPADPNTMDWDYWNNLIQEAGINSGSA